MKKIILPVIVTIPLLVIGFSLFSMSEGDIEDIVICATNDESHYIPSGVCEYYLFNFRLTKNDIEFIESRSGLNFLFGISDKTKRDKLLKYFISKGVSINKQSGIDGYTPLHAAIIDNDPELVKFLLNKGANVNQKDTSHNLTPEEFLEFLNREIIFEDRSAIKNILAAHKKQAHKQ